MQSIKAELERIGKEIEDSMPKVKRYHIGNRYYYGTETATEHELAEFRKRIDYIMKGEIA